MAFNVNTGNRQTTTYWVPGINKCRIVNIDLESLPTNVEGESFTTDSFVVTVENEDGKQVKCWGRNPSFLSQLNAYVLGLQHFFVEVTSPVRTAQDDENTWEAKLISYADRCKEFDDALTPIGAAVNEVAPEMIEREAQKAPGYAIENRKQLAPFWTQILDVVFDPKFKLLDYIGKEGYGVFEWRGSSADKIYVNPIELGRFAFKQEDGTWGHPWFFFSEEPIIDAFMKPNVKSPLVMTKEEALAKKGVKPAVPVVAEKKPITKF